MTSAAIQSGAASGRPAFWRTLAAAAVLLAGAGGLSALIYALNWTIDKPPMPLRKPLGLVPETFQTHVAGGQEDTLIEYVMRKQELLPKEITESLGTSDYLVRQYVLKSGSERDLMVLNVNYYPTGGSSPHVPDIYWQASGMQKYGDGKEIVVKNVPRADGSVADLKMMLLSFRPSASDMQRRPEVTNERDLLRNVVYTFNVNGEYVATRHEVMSQFWKPGNKYAYHAKIEVTMPWRCSPEEALPQIGTFVRAAIPEVEKALPDPRETPATAPADPGGSPSEDQKSSR